MPEPPGVFHQCLNHFQTRYTSYHTVIPSAVRYCIQVGSCQNRGERRIFPFQSCMDISGLVHSWLNAKLPEVIHKCFSSLYILRGICHPSKGSVLFLAALIDFFQTGVNSFNVYFHDLPPLFTQFAQLDFSILVYLLCFVHHYR